jgi:DNA primase
MTNLSSLIHKYVTVFNENPEEIQALCPWPHKDKNGNEFYESKPSLNINKVKGVFNCFGCGRSGTIHRFFESFVGAFFADVLLVEFEFDREWVEPDTEPAPLPFYNDGIEYFKKRGFTDDSIRRFNLGENRQLDSAIIPIPDNEGVYAGWKARHRSGGYYFSGYGLPAEDILFNYSRYKGIRKSEPLFIVEGEFDCIWLDQHGRKAVSLLGSSSPKARIPAKWELLTEEREVRLCLDNDGAGVRCTELLGNYLDEKGVNVTIVKFPDKYKDVQQIPTKLVRRYIK